MIVYSKRYLEHNQGYHPENNNRLKRTISLLTEKNVFDHVPLVEPEPAENEDVLRVHTERHLNHIRDFSLKGGGMIDPDTYLNQNSSEIAMLSAGGIITEIGRASCRERV